MSGSTFTIAGLAELRAALRTLPADLTGEASEILIDEGDQALNEIVTGYPERARSLRSKTKKTVRDIGTAGVGLVITNTAKEATWFEIGTQARHTALGANRGSMPAGNVFIPPIQRHRRAAMQRLKAMMERNGLTVGGTDG
jgi:hypothetical protein